MSESIAKLKRDQPCRHFWIIPTPDGPTSEGKCKFCHEKGTFINYFPAVSPLTKKAIWDEEFNLEKVPVAI
jgi:hypothetical protein